MSVSRSLELNHAWWMKDLRKKEEEDIFFVNIRKACFWGGYFLSPSSLSFEKCSLRRRAGNDQTKEHRQQGHSSSELSSTMFSFTFRVFCFHWITWKLSSRWEDLKTARKKASIFFLWPSTLVYNSYVWRPMHDENFFQLINFKGLYFQNQVQFQ